MLTGEQKHKLRSQVSSSAFGISILCIIVGGFLSFYIKDKGFDPFIIITAIILFWLTVMTSIYIAKKEINKVIEEIDIEDSYK